MTSDWAGTAEAYNKSFARLCRGTVPAIIEATRSVRGVALDVGTGTGTVASALSDVGFSAIGVDSDPGMVEFASHAHPALPFRVGALPALPLENGGFDLVVANFVLNHAPKPREAARELVRVAQGGGIVIATIWPSEPVSALNRLWGAVIRDSGITPPDGLRLSAADDFERSPSGLARLLADAGLDGVTVEEVSWVFTIDAADLWVAVEAGIATIGTTYRHQGEAGRVAMRDAYDAMTGGRELSFPSTAVMGWGTVEREHGTGDRR